MNPSFPKRIALLRKERGLSQKKAAEELGISQALLSHYEKGVRECGLDFLCNIAAYYNVSCDYLLGRTRKRRLDKPNEEELVGESTSTLFAAKKQIMDLLHVLYDHLSACQNKSVSSDAMLFLQLAVYRLLRCLSDGQDIYRLSPLLSHPMADATMTMLESSLRQQIQEHLDLQLLCDEDSLRRQYPDLTENLLALVTTCEAKLAPKKAKG